ncbi:MAG TPA: hypothetical protein VF594_03730 [Rubricoccaceae bacterium]|jgi:hypothetical protein
MNTTPTLGEIRPSITPGDALAEPHHEPFVVPLLRLRGYDRPVIEPEDCLVTGCLICAWRKAGLLDAPRIANCVVRESASGYACPTSYCPGCNTIRCVCPPEGYEEALVEAAYELGHEHGAADGPDNRPTVSWLLDADLDAESYLTGYDDACAGLPVGMPAEPLSAQPPSPVLWDDLDDLLPF